MFIEVPTGPEEYANPDHLQFFSERSLTKLLERHFQSARIWRNSYSTTDGMVLGSLYGLGHGPKPPCPATDEPMAASLASLRR